jgi:hypothetical protein
LFGVGSKLRLGGDSMAADVQAWVDDDVENLGWLLSGNRTAKRLHSSDGNENLRPTLTIEYQPGESDESDNDSE